MRSPRRAPHVAATAALLALSSCASRPWYDRPTKTAAPGSAAAKGQRPAALARKPCGREPVAPSTWRSIVQIRAGAKYYFQADHYDKAANLMPKRFPPLDSYAYHGKRRFDSAWTQPCSVGRARWAAQWKTLVWRELQFHPTRCDSVQFRFESWGTNRKARYRLRVRRDPTGGIDCRYNFTGEIDHEYGVVTHGPAHARPNMAASRPTR